MFHPCAMTQHWINASNESYLWSFGVMDEGLLRKWSPAAFRNITPNRNFIMMSKTSWRVANWNRAVTGIAKELSTANTPTALVSANLRSHSWKSIVFSLRVTLPIDFFYLDLSSTTEAASLTWHRIHEFNCLYQSVIRSDLNDVFLTVVIEIWLAQLAHT